MPASSPLIAATIGRIRPPDAAARAAASARIAQLTMPPRALGRLLELAEDLAGICGTIQPVVDHKTVVVMAGDHGVCAAGVSAFPQEVTPQMVGNFANGGAAINVLADIARARVVVADLGVAADLSALANAGRILDRKVAWGTANLADGPAMSRDQAIASVEAGIGIANDLARVTEVFATGDMGIGNTTPSACIVACLTGEAPERVTGRGTGVDDAALARKTAVVARALTINRPDPRDGLDVLAKVGGFEIGGIAGLCLGAAALGKPVVVDGFISTAGALIAQALCPMVAQRLILAHRSAEPGHVAATRHLGREPLIDLGFRLGEGTGAAVAFPLLDAAVAVLTRMATFQEATVAQARKTAAG